MDINSINLIQAMFDSYSKEAEKERAETQMTLGDLIQRLQQLPEDAKIYFTEPHSYRGYYSDLSFEPSREPISPSQALNLCYSVRGSVLEGYKGGDFPMHDNVPVWIAYYGCTGMKLIDINGDGSFITEEDKW